MAQLINATSVRSTFEGIPTGSAPGGVRWNGIRNGILSIAQSAVSTKIANHLGKPLDNRNKFLPESRLIFQLMSWLTRLVCHVTLFPLNDIKSSRWDLVQDKITISSILSRNGGSASYCYANNEINRGPRPVKSGVDGHMAGTSHWQPILRTRLLPDNENEHFCMRNHLADVGVRMPTLRPHTAASHANVA